MEGFHQPAATTGILQQRSAAAAKSQSAAADGTGQLESHEQAKGALSGQLRLQVSRRCVRGAAQPVQ